MKYFGHLIRPVSRVFLHCSASSVPAHGDVAVIRRWHTDAPPLGRGWSDVGYHFFIPFNGLIQTGRHINVTPVAQKGHNNGTIAICLHGLKETDFTPAQFESLRVLCNELNETPPIVTFHGHCEVSAKACPVFDYKAVLGLDSKGRMGGKSSKPTPAPVTDLLYPVVSKSSKNTEAVRRVQGLLNIPADGIFGTQTLKAVVEFQLGNRLPPDGIVGPLTWNKLERRE